MKQKRRAVITIYESAKGGTQPWRWRLRTGNNKILIPPEGFVSRRNVRRSIFAVKWALLTARIEYTSKEGTT